MVDACMPSILVNLLRLLLPPLSLMTPLLMMVFLVRFLKIILFKIISEVRKNNVQLKIKID